MIHAVKTVRQGKQDWSAQGGDEAWLGLSFKSGLIAMKRLEVSAGVTVWLLEEEQSKLRSCLSQHPRLGVCLGVP